MATLSDQVRAFAQDLDRKVRDAKTAAVKAGGEVAKRAILDELRRGSPGKGHAYKRGKKRVHVASRRGDAPARDKGVLIRSIAAQFNDGRNPSVEVGVKSTAPYAKFLDPPPGEREPRIGRRPFVSSGWRNAQPNVRRVIERELRDGLNRITKRRASIP